MTSFREYRDRPEANPIEVIHANHALPPGARGFQGQRAGFVSRAIAASIDVLLIFVTVLLTAAALWMLGFIIDPTTITTDTGSRVPPVLYMVAYGYFLNWAYWTVCWALSGRTMGNLVMGVRVVSRKGQRLGWGGAALRAAFCALFPIGLLWVVISRANRSLQDVVLRTNVIYDWVVGLPTLSRVLGRTPYEQEQNAVPT